MKKLVFILSLLFGVNIFGNDIKQLDPSILSLVPDGYLPVNTAFGDLNKDGQDDVVLLIKATNKENFVVLEDKYSTLFDLNPSHLLVALKDGDKYKIVAKNSSFSPSKDTDDLWTTASLYLKINKGNLYLTFNFARYDSAIYTFHYKDDGVNLIGFDLKYPFLGGGYVDVQSFNFITNKMVHKKVSNNSAGKEVSQDAWKNFTTKKNLSLENIYFPDLSVRNLVDIID